MHRPSSMTPTLSDYRNAVAAVGIASDAASRRIAVKAATRLRRTIYEDCAKQTLARRLDPSRDAARESMVWFWFNHFNVYWQKNLVGAALPSYVDEAIRPNVYGRFRDLLLAATTHPAMLTYLDNVRNVDGRINENLARELLELHTLGVDGGYTQADVQETARLLTGFGLRPVGKKIGLPPRAGTPQHERGEFLFDPRRHDFGAKLVLGKRIEGQGYAEIEVLVDMLATHPSTARHLARRLCMYRLGDAVPAAVERVVATAYLGSGGRLDTMTAAIDTAREGNAAPAGRTFKDPMKWLLDAMVLLAGHRPVADVALVQRWLGLLGQPLFGRATPDGYSLRGTDWVSAGQLAQRFELAQEIVAMLPRLLGTSAGSVQWVAVLESPGVRALESRLGRTSRVNVEAADSPADRLALLLASPEFMYA